MPIIPPKTGEDFLAVMALLVSDFGFLLFYILSSWFQISDIIVEIWLARNNDIIASNGRSFMSDTQLHFRLQIQLTVDS